MGTLRILQIEDTCTGCGACANICPKKCIEMRQNVEGFYYPSLDNSKCINCHLCEKVCHVINPYSNDTVPHNGFVIYRNSSDSIREESTSGGAFTLLAEYVLKENGVVFGSYFNDKNGRLEVADSAICNWQLFRKSKYIETFTGSTFVDVARYLKENRMVLYCSTPCQIRGLKQFLKTKKIDDTSLITVDLICHGVPSSSFFKYFLDKYRDKQRIIAQLDFRFKDFSDPNHMWHSQCIVFHYVDGTRMIFPDTPPCNLYYKAFNDGISLRKCCYKCNHPYHSYADFTIADFWGISNYPSLFDDNKGTSLIKCNTLKAKKIWNNSKDKGYRKELEYEYGKYVYDKKDKSPLLSKRNLFYKLASKYGYNVATLSFYGKMTLIFKIKRIIKSFLRVS